MPTLAYSIGEAAEATGLGRSTIKDLIRTGELRSVKIRDRRLIPADALDELVANGTTA